MDLIHKMQSEQSLALQSQNMQEEFPETDFQ